MRTGRGLARGIQSARCEPWRVCHTTVNSSRSKSTTAAINRGIIRSRPRIAARTAGRPTYPRRDGDALLKRQDFGSDTGVFPKPSARHHLKRTRHVPPSIPYSTAISEFLYGNSSVTAALVARRRKLFKLYQHPRANASSHSAARTLSRLASRASVEIVEVDDLWLPLMDKASQGRPHNGLVLEASALPKWSASALETVVSDDRPEAPSKFGVIPAGKDRPSFTLPFERDGWRQPFVLMIDDILDPGNLGAIIRSAYYLGVDCLAVCWHTCAPLTSVALKASAGAAEAMPILSIHEARPFLSRSKDNGWAVYVAVTPDETAKSRHLTTAHANDETLLDSKSSSASVSTICYTDVAAKVRLARDYFPLSQRPSILLLGGEGRGLKRSLRSLADFTVSLTPAKRSVDIGVDSLNVGVAAAVLSAEFLRRPTAVHATVHETNSSFTAAKQADLGGELGF